MNHFFTFIQLIENKGPLHVSSITCSSSGGTAQTAFGMLRTYNVRWLWHGCSFNAAVPQPNAVCAVPPEDKQVMLETGRGPSVSVNWMKVKTCNTLVSLHWLILTLTNLKYLAFIALHHLWIATGQEDVNLEIRKRKLRGIGHTLRKEDVKIPKAARRRSVIKEARRSWNELRFLAADRSWKNS
jgi:hypothetical protein